MAASSESSAESSSKLGAVTAKLRQVNPSAAKDSAQSGLGGVKDVMQMAVSYAKQETVEPLKGAGRYAAYGLAAASLIGTGLVLIVLGALRGIQLLTGADPVEGKDGTMDGNWSFVPYFLTAVVCIAIIAVIVVAMRRSLRSGGTR